jgi:hypothetical protein
MERRSSLVSFDQQQSRFRVDLGGNALGMLPSLGVLCEEKWTVFMSQFRSLPDGLSLGKSIAWLWTAMKVVVTNDVEIDGEQGEGGDGGPHFARGRQRTRATCTP